MNKRPACAAWIKSPIWYGGTYFSELPATILRIASQLCAVRYVKSRKIPHAAVSHCLSFSLSLLFAACRRAYVHVALCVYVRDRYAIARAPTESMKIKREYSSPSEVKDALECRTAPCSAVQRDVTQWRSFRHPLVRTKTSIWFYNIRWLSHRYFSNWLYYNI